jgi:hypothetical protein
VPCGIVKTAESERQSHSVATRVILACEMIEDEVLLALERIDRTIGAGSLPHSPPLVWIESGLHEYPERLRAHLQGLVDCLDEGAREGRHVVLPSVRPGKGPAAGRLEEVTVAPAGDILFATGFCGKGLEGLVSRTAWMVFPRVDDCISLLLNCGCTREEIQRDAHAFYFTRGWLCHKNPMLDSCEKYKKRFGPGNAYKRLRAALAVYQRITLIDTGAYDLAGSQLETEALAKDLELEHTVVPGSVQLLERLFTGSWNSEIVVIPPGEPITIWHLFDTCSIPINQ